MERKYEFTGETKEIDFCVLHRIVAVKDFGFVKAGDRGGWIEDEYNLSHSGTAWVADEAAIYGDALVEDDAFVGGRVLVRDDAHVGGRARLYEFARVEGDACIRGNTKVYGWSHVHGNALVEGWADVCGCADLQQNAHVDGYALVSDNTEVYGNAHITGSTSLYGTACVCGNALIRSDEDWITVTGFGTGGMCATFFRGSDEKIYVYYDFFHGTVDRFLEKIKGTKYESTFTAVIEAACMRFNLFSSSCENSSPIIVEESDKYVSFIKKARSMDPLLCGTCAVNVKRKNGTKYWMDKDMSKFYCDYLDAFSKAEEKFKDLSVQEVILTLYSCDDEDLCDPFDFHIRFVREGDIVRVYPDGNFSEYIS